MLDTATIKQDFPILNQLVHDEPLVYLDSAATSQKPLRVLEAVRDYYHEDNANVHRGVHCLGERATLAYEGARETVRAFLNAQSTKEIIFTSGTTAALNLVAGFAGQILQPGDEVLVSVAEHHANLIPWQQVCQRTGAKLRHVGLAAGELDLVDLISKLSDRTRFVSLAHVSNVLGYIAPIKEIAQLAHAKGAYLVVDAAQSVPHLSVDVHDLDCDFLAFSGHKVMGPTGTGVLYGKEDLLRQFEPISFGGEMIAFVDLDQATWADLPWKFEPGTPNIAGAIGLAAALNYLSDLGLPAVLSHCQDLTTYTLERLQALEGVTVYGPTNPERRSGLISFALEGVHPHDLATALDYEGVALRAGQHCAQPLHRYLGAGASLRASFYLYNDRADCDRLIAALETAK